MSTIQAAHFLCITQGGEPGPGKALQSGPTVTEMGLWLVFPLRGRTFKRPVQCHLDSPACPDLAADDRDQELRGLTYIPFTVLWSLRNRNRVPLNNIEDDSVS